ncbi:hypothetical protein [Siphonobacter sp. SORGH_AS_1065]|uniref:hypothetical protein n=1 Tax=Siphonobacter sp. SORGH_AS_1065 TaxID=3041795 RepID=UPI002786144C|nr:hypothetical protein [Siphonobacter sp. SORGH_AS_1065]MDQ1088339.1 hypothetical protein [Siphonobacter sp. SORGH_AS_1065]
MKKFFTPLAFLIGFGFITACQKAEDPFVPRVVSPVLVQVLGAPYQMDFATEPTVTLDGTKATTLTARILELDKTNILDHTKGIDSIPVANLPVKLTLRNGTQIGEATTDSKGIVTFAMTWAQLGISTPASGNRAAISWKGEYKGQAFTRLSAVQVK